MITIKKRHYSLKMHCVLRVCNAFWSFLDDVTGENGVQAGYPLQDNYLILSDCPVV